MVSFSYEGRKKLLKYTINTQQIQYFVPQINSPQFKKVLLELVIVANHNHLVHIYSYGRDNKLALSFF
jgi:hypothetical protein